MRTDIYPIELIGSGFLAVMAKPVAGEFVRDSFREIRQQGVKQVVSLLEEPEAIALGLFKEEQYVLEAGMSFLSYPLADRGVPRSVERFGIFTLSLYHQIAGGCNTVIHCRAGIGRSGLVAAAVLLHCGFDPIQAFSHVSKARRVSVPDTEEQVAWLKHNYRSIVRASM